ncbi:hypothetical protein PYCC9005_001286 [Savitreella phatthalungensis]
MKRGRGASVSAGKARKKTKTIPKVDKASQVAAEADGSDIDDIQDYAQYAQFLSQLDPDSLASIKKPKRKEEKPDRKPVQTQDSDSEQSEDDVPVDEDEENEQAMLKHMNISRRKERLEGSLLPVKMLDGSVVAPKKQGKIAPASREASPENVDEAEPDEQNTISTARAEHDNDTLEELLEKLARVANKIVQDPEEYFPQIGTIWAIHNESHNKLARRFALLTLASVFKDCIPGYRIRPLTEAEQKEKVTKEVRRLRTFEQGLLYEYHRLVQRLTELTKLPAKDVEVEKVAMSSVCVLLNNHSHFNYRDDLLAILVDRLCRSSEGQDRVHETLLTICRDDEQGEATLELVKQLSKRIKDRSYKVPTQAIDICLSFRVLSDFHLRASHERLDRSVETEDAPNGKKKKQREFRNKRERKALREQKEIEKEMLEASAAVDTEAKEKAQGETLKVVFALYFHLLRDGPRRCKAAALHGLAKFSHLVNFDFFGDLLEVLKELIAGAHSAVTTGEEALRNDEYILLCISTAFRLVAGQPTTKESAGLDLTAFVHELYRLCTVLCMDQSLQPLMKDKQVGDAEDSTAITLAETYVRCLDVVLFQRQSPGNLRALAFCKRLLTASLSTTDERASVALATLVQRARSRGSSSRLMTLFDSDDLIVGAGQYKPEQDNYELSNASSTLGFEASLMSKHFSPKMRELADQLLNPYTPE